MPNKSKKLIKRLEEALIYEEKALVESQYDLMEKLPANFNEQEIIKIRDLLDALIIQSLNHIHIVSDLIIKFYEDKPDERI